MVTISWNAEKVNSSTYLGLFPFLLAEESGRQVIVIYQPGVSKVLPLTKGIGYYSEETEKQQLEAAIEVADGKPFTPITHSLSSILGIRLLDKTYRNQCETTEKQILPGVLSAVYTDMEDGLRNENGKQRKLLGLIPWYPLLRAVQHLQVPVPLYPLASSNVHDDFTAKPSRNKRWGASHWLNTAIAGYILKIDTGLELVGSLKTIDQQPLGIATMHDKIFSAERQIEIYNALGAEVLQIDTGHRWTTNQETEHAIRRIARFHQKNLEMRL